jgi:aconitase B
VMNIVDQTLRNDVYCFLMLQPHSPDNRGLARECKDVKIDGVYMGSCTGGKTEDFLAAAQLMATSVSFLHAENTFLVSDDSPRLKPNYCVMDLQGSIISICDYIQGSESSEVHRPSRIRRRVLP